MYRSQAAWPRCSISRPELYNMLLDLRAVFQAAEYALAIWDIYLTASQTTRASEHLSALRCRIHGLILDNYRPSKAISATKLLWRQFLILEPDLSKISWGSPQPPIVERRLVIIAIGMTLNIEHLYTDAVSVVNLRKCRAGEA